ncbi:hypothetical protein [Rhizorhabdus dicambivorans]|uniref:hypothetical protein n=1 Tax=Rhizorhabdus dicambivorans TaxID=1850238 RepID=UPI0015968C4D|nr:hypothetical protein [Rhizorhabdus dicambivorans]
MSDKTDHEIEKIEENQQELRKSIQRTKQLSEETEKLLAQHKAGLKKRGPAR